MPRVHACRRPLDSKESESGSCMTYCLHLAFHGHYTFVSAYYPLLEDWTQTRKLGGSSPITVPLAAIVPCPVSYKQDSQTCQGRQYRLHLYLLRMGRLTGINFCEYLRRRCGRQTDSSAISAVRPLGYRTSYIIVIFVYQFVGGFNRITQTFKVSAIYH